MVLGLCRVVSVEKLNWKLIRVWIPVNVIFIGMLVSGMYRYVWTGIVRYSFMSNCLDLQRREADPKYEENIGEEKKSWLNSHHTILYLTYWNVLFNIHVQLMFLVHFCFQFEVHKYSNGDSSEEHDKYSNSNWRIVYISKTSESKSVDCNVFNGKWHTSSNMLSMNSLFLLLLMLTVGSKGYSYLF